MAEDQQPATKQDLAAMESRLKNEFRSELKDALKDALTDTKSDLMEAMRDMQTEILRGFERFANAF